MARLVGRLERFNRDFEFSCGKPMLVNGVKVLPGQPIDKSKFTTRRLRQLYEWRYIRRVEPILVQGGYVPAPGPKPQAPTTDSGVMPKKRGRPKKIAA
jgi:hypothetical protein